MSIPWLRPARTRVDGPGRVRCEPDVFLALFGISRLTVHFGLLIRGFGVRVPGGAPVIKALTWCFSPDQSRFHVHSGRLCAPRVLWSRRTVSASDRLTGLNGTGPNHDGEAGWSPYMSGRATI